jgi:hypothetical protein
LFQFDLFEAQLRIKNYKSNQAVHEADLSSMHSVFMSTASLLHTSFYVLKGLNSTSPDMEKRYDNLIAMMRNPCNVTFQQERIQEAQILQEEEMKEEVRSQSLMCIFVIGIPPLKLLFYIIYYQAIN